ncbi:hypothetical protein BDY17DRAFT_327478 [Neohortaea acidophila]|uniref:DUF7587 domain-containing protein n=1 Tax=Neohortaea acidophila TaxID=245834 RepID=A0A6A6PHX2_9PEZI|nr:uncharacterized protein BDY17DRAFT_327478 [Neohortaea acidophila]KAF2479515.1 hypothetical protein BDY17DRAFT_327478 [Neohortaea acidophila]
MAPRYLLRAFSDVSNGTNTRHGFAPAGNASERQSSYKGLKYNKDVGALNQQLKVAEYGKEAPENPFIFATVSLLYALQHAWKKGRKCKRWAAGNNIQIVVIDTGTAKTSGGEPVAWHRVQDLMAELGLKLTAKYSNHVIDYSDVWVTTDDIVLGEGSYHASFDELKQARLFDLCPELSACWQGLEKPVNDLRRLWYEQDKKPDWTGYDVRGKEISLAAKIADVFKPVRDPKSDYVDPHLFAILLALKNESANSPHLRAWLDLHSSANDEDVTDVTESVQDTGMPEVDKATALFARLRQRRVMAADVLLLETTIPEDHMALQKKAYLKDRLKRNEEKNKVQTEKRAAKRKLELEASMEAAKKARLETQKSGEGAGKDGNADAENGEADETATTGIEAAQEGGTDAPADAKADAVGAYGQAGQNLANSFEPTQEDSTKSPSAGTDTDGLQIG